MFGDCVHLFTFQSYTYYKAIFIQAALSEDIFRNVESNTRAQDRSSPVKSIESTDLLRCCSTALKKAESGKGYRLSCVTLGRTLCSDAAWMIGFSAVAAGASALLQHCPCPSTSPGYRV